MPDELLLVPKRGVSWADIEQAMVQLGATEQEPQDSACLFEWELHEVRLRLLEDAGLHVEVIAVEGASREEAGERLRALIPTYQPDDMPGLFASTSDDEELDENLSLLALVAPPSVDLRLLELFRQGFGHPDPSIRERALIAASVRTWPELVDDVKRLLEDGDEEVRETAAVVLREFDRVLRGKPS